MADTKYSARANKQKKPRSNGNGLNGKKRENSASIEVETIRLTESRDVQYIASLYPGASKPIDKELAVAVLEIEKILGIPTWVLLQNGGSGPFESLDTSIEKLIIHDLADVHKKPGPIALILESPGGIARSAYKVARFFDKRYGGFKVVIPSYAKSAATLLALGATEIIMSRDAELGPLDAQVWDERTERRASAIDEVQAIERLMSSSLDALDMTMSLLSKRSMLKSEVILRESMSFVTHTLQPLYDKIDSVHYSEMERTLLVAEAYAVRLLAKSCDPLSAKRIAARLIREYPEHGFVIDSEEAKRIGLRVITYDEDTSLQNNLDILSICSTNETVIGRIREVEPNDDFN